MQFQIEDRLSVPAELAAAHATMPQQSVNVLNSTCTEENKLIRIFLGTAVIVHLSSGKRIPQSTNYSVLGAPTVTGRTYKVIEAQLAVYDVTPMEVDKLLRKTLSQRAYYQDLLSEICNVLWRTKTGEHTLAFLHLYRFLEHISFAFPLLYAARTSDFNGAFASLKELLSDAEKKELSFFRKFVETSIEAHLRSQTVKVVFNDVDLGNRHAVYFAIKNQVSALSRTSTVLDTEIEIKYDGILDLCINLRNRYFHFAATNPQNISSSGIGDSDVLFSRVNQPILNWLAVLYFETLKHRVNAA